jgi:hypothetical protein
LSGVANTPEEAARAARELFARPPHRYWTQSLMYNLYWVSQHRDPAVRAAARAPAREFCLRYLSGERTYVLVADFAQVAVAEDVPLLEEIVANPDSPASKHVALAALARLDSGKAVDHVLAYKARRGPYHGYLSIFLRHATEADAKRVIPLVRPTRRDFLPEGEIHLTGVVRLMARFGEAGRAELRRWVERLSGNLRTRAEWVLKGITLRPVLEALTAAGALPGDAGALMAGMRPDTELDEGDPGLIAAAFVRAGRGVYFDVGNGPIMQDLDRLRVFTAGQTGGLFDPECCLAEPRGEGPDAPVTVRFLHGGRAFSFETTAYCFPYDISAVTQAANAALEASGCPERFLVMSRGILGPVLILTDPAKYRPVASRFHLQAHDDASPVRRPTQRRKGSG